MVRGVVALLSVLVAVRTATADPVRLEVKGGVCDFGHLESQLTQMLGSDPVDPNARASVRVDVTKPGDQLAARILFDDGDDGIRGPRIVTSRNCRDLVESVALVVAMALPELPAAPSVNEMPPPASVVDPPSPVSAPTPVSDQPPAPPMPPPVAAAPAPGRLSPEPSTHALGLATRDLGSRSVGQLDTDLFAAGASGFTSGGVQGQVIVGIRVRRDVASLSAEIRADLPEEHDVERMSGISVFRTQVSLSPCLHFGSVAGCAVASAGTIHGSAVGLTSARSAYTPLLTGGLRMTWEHRLGPGVALRLHVDADALLTTSRFDVDNMQVWVSPRFEGAAGVGVLAHFL